MTLHDGVPVPKVIGFGIAKATEARLTDSTGYTRLQQMLAGHRDSIVSLYFSQLRSHLVTASLDGTAIVWKITPRPPRP